MPTKAGAPGSPWLVESQKLEPRGRSILFAERYLQEAQYKLAQPQFCGQCCLLKANCICSALALLRQQRQLLAAESMLLHWIVLVNAKERYRSNNSGKLLTALLDAEFIIEDLDDERLQQASSTISSSIFDIIITIRPLICTLV